MNPSAALHFSPPVEGRRYRDVSPPTASGAVGRGHWYQQAVSVNQQRLETAFETALLRIKAELSLEETRVANAAIRQAVTIFGAVDFEEMPAMAVTDVGTAIVQWQKKDRGAMFSFTGNPEFVVALKRGQDSRYSDDVQLESVDKRLPTDTLDLIRDLSKP